MQDAFGGIVNLALIVLFLVIVEGILGMTVNYTKAFKMKNVVLSAVEQYEASACFGDNADSGCLRKIQEDARSIGYSPSNLRCPRFFTAKTDSQGRGLFCYRQMEVVNSASSKQTYYRIVTQVDVHIPIIREILSLEFFQVKGDTRMIDISNK